jgi:hypothetical protein
MLAVMLHFHFVGWPVLACDLLNFFVAASFAAVIVHRARTVTRFFRCLGIGGLLALILRACFGFAAPMTREAAAYRTCAHAFPCDVHH